MTSLLKVVGALLLVPAVLLVLLVPVAFLDDHANAVPGLLMLAVLFGGPGGYMRYRGVQRGREEALQQQMVGFIRSRDAFSVDELAAQIGKTPAEAQTLLTADIARYRLPLMLHRASGRYLRLDRLSSTAQVADKCQSCGGSIDAQIVFAHEQLSCPYCGSPVQGHAPVVAGGFAGGFAGGPGQPGGYPGHGGGHGHW